MNRAPRNHQSTASPKATSPDTRALLITAAGEAFNTAGYFGTDTNRIARQAGFAPQTFYRHFTDKLEIFLAVYERWRADEAAAIAAAIKRRPGNARASAAATAIIQHHRDWAMFRRSLRLLAVEEPRVRVARAAGREAQLAALGALPANAGRSKVERAAALLTVERLCDALADGEPQDLGIKDSHWIALVAKAVAAARGE